MFCDIGALVIYFFFTQRYMFSVLLILLKLFSSPQMFG